MYVDWKRRAVGYRRMAKAVLERAMVDVVGETDSTERLSVRAKERERRGAVEFFLSGKYRIWAWAGEVEGAGLERYVDGLDDEG